MKIILVKDLSTLGEEGDIKVVADGYARNYLIPKNIAIPYNKSNLSVLEQRKAAIERRKEEKRKEALGLKEKIESTEIKLSMTAGEKGKLFGAVTAASLVDALAAEGIVVEKKSVEIPDHTIKTVGNFNVSIKLYNSEKADLKVLVEATEK